MLIVEDDVPTRRALAAALEEGGHEVHEASGVASAIRELDRRTFHGVICDLVLGDGSGLEVLAHARHVCPDTFVVMVTGYGSVDSAVEAIKLGAWDYLTKPVDLDRLDLVIERGLGRQSLLAENARLRQQIGQPFSAARIVGRSRALHEALECSERVAASHANVLITGENGTGKELFVDAIHRGSPRAGAPMVKVNCPALAEGIFESELFGHERGAFTGAMRRRRGRFEAAHGGTLFLDEIGELSPAMQAKLLRAIEYGTIERVGGSQPIQVDVRVVAATNRDIDRDVAEGRFREDLFFRLAVLRVHVPPLRERHGDVPLLVNHFLGMFSERHGKRPRAISGQAMDALCAYSWPGNVRELRNCVESLVVLARKPRIGRRDLPPHISGTHSPRISIPVGTTVSEANRQLVDATLEASGWNKTRAARTLGIGLRTLYRWLSEWDEGGEGEE